MSVLLMIGDSREMLDCLPAGSVQMVCTSPPYYNLRSYLSAGDPNKAKEIGGEQTPDAYVENLVAVFRSVWRVLHPSGVVFLNLGDSYANTGASGPNSGLAALADKFAPRLNPRNPTRDEAGAVPRGEARKIPVGLKPKDLLMIPARAALALQADGWWVRSHIAWTKTKVMPDSAKDRPTAAWESIYILTRSDTYFWDYEGAKEPALSAHASGNKARKSVGGDSNPDGKHLAGSVPWEPTEKRNMRNVWQFNSTPHPEHFATYPPELPRRAITAATSEHGCCPTCRSPYRRIVEKGEPDLDHQRACGSDVTGEYDGQATKDYLTAGAQNASDVKRRILAGMVKKVTVGWEPTCRCPPLPPVPCIVLDPFSGSGTTVMVAQQLGRDSIGVDLKPEYAGMARGRLAKAGLLGP